MHVDVKLHINVYVRVERQHLNVIIKWGTDVVPPKCQFVTYEF